MLRRTILVWLLIGLIAPMTLVTAAPTTSAAQWGGTAPVSIRIPHALVDTSIEPLRIVNAVPQVTTSPWTVGWYQETGGLGVPGNPVMYGHTDWPEVGPAALFLADQLQPGHEMEISGADGFEYTYRVEWIETYGRWAAPIQEIFVDPPAEHLLTLYFNGEPQNFNTGEYENVVVVRARQVAATASTGPAITASTLNAQPECPVAPASLDLPWSLQVYPYPVVAPSPYADRNQMGVPSASRANDDAVAAINTLIAETTTCDVAVREALMLPDGYVLALVGPSGALPFHELANAVSVPDRGVVNATTATLFDFLLFAEEEEGWRHLPHPVG